MTNRHTPQQIGELLCHWVSAALKKPLDECTPSARFDELGLDSIVAVNLTFEIQDAFQIELADNFLYEFPSIESAAAELARRMDPPETAVSI